MPPLKVTEKEGIDALYVDPKTHEIMPYAVRKLPSVNQLDKSSNTEPAKARRPRVIR